MHIPKWLIATAGLLLVALIASVAFFIGRESAEPPQAAITNPASAPEPEASPGEPSGAAIASPIAQSAGEPAVTAPPSTAITSQSGTATPAAAVDTSPATTEARARVSAYFEQMEGLQPGDPVGDQEAFATALLQGAASGDFSGIDNLVRVAADAERGAAALQPPAECAEYHRMAVTLLQESRTMITALRDGLKRNDANALASIGASAQSMKSRADTLQAAEKALRARFGL